MAKGKGANMKDKRKIIIPVIMILIIVAYFIIKNNGRKNPNEISGSGTIEVTEVDISAKLMGRIEKINFDEGDIVKKGNLLFVLNHDELNDQLKQFEAGLNASKEQIEQIEVQLKNSKDNLIRAKDLFRSGSYSQQQLDAAETQYKMLSAQFNSAKQLNNQASAQLDYIKTQIGNAYIYSPISGVILKKNSEAGEIISPGMAILTIGDLSKPWLKIYISETDLGKIKLNDEVAVKVDSFPDRSFEGRVVYISSQSEFTPKNIQTKDERTRLVYAVKINLQNKEQFLKPGMPADAVIYVKGN